MSIEHQRTEMVYDVITDLLSEDRTSIRPGDVCDELRSRNTPIGTWQVRAEFSQLEAQGRLVCDAATGDWQLSAAPAAEAKSAG